MKSIVAIFLGVFSCGVFAVGEVNDAKVMEVRADKSGKGYVKFDKALSGAPASCISGGHTSHLSFDLNTPGGKGIMSIALSAQATGNSVRAVGTGSCDDFSVVESWNYGLVR